MIVWSECVCTSSLMILILNCLMQTDEARIGREVQAHEKKIRKELEKQDLLRRKVGHCSLD